MKTKTETRLVDYSEVVRLAVERQDAEPLDWTEITVAMSQKETNG